MWFCLINMFLCGELRSSSPYRGVMWDPFVTLQDLQDTELWKMGKETFQEMMLGFLELNWNKVYHHHWCRKRGGLMWRSDKGQCFHRDDGKKDVGSEWWWIIGCRLFWRLWCRAKGVSRAKEKQMFEVMFLGFILMYLLALSGKGLAWTT